MLSAKFVMNDGSNVEVNGKLAEYFHTVFSAASASSAVSKRGERAAAIEKHFTKIAGLAEAKELVIETSEEIITVKTNNILALLAGIPSAIACNDLYKEAWEKVEKNPSDKTGKKGRKELDVEAELLASL